MPELGRAKLARFQGVGGHSSKKLRGQLECRTLRGRAHQIGRRGLLEIRTLVTPDTLLRWYRQLITNKYDSSMVRRVGRPKTAAAIQQLILGMARENPGWGHTRIRGALRNLGHEIGRNTIKRILQENGIDPAPLRKMPWGTTEHYHAERNHQGLENRLIEEPPRAAP